MLVKSAAPMVFLVIALTRTGTGIAAPIADVASASLPRPHATATGSFNLRDGARYVLDLLRRNLTIEGHFALDGLHFDVEGRDVFGKEQGGAHPGGCSRILRGFFDRMECSPQRCTLRVSIVDASCKD